MTKVINGKIEYMSLSESLNFSKFSFPKYKIKELV